MTWACLIFITDSKGKKVANDVLPAARTGFFSSVLAGGASRWRTVRQCDGRSQHFRSPGPTAECRHAIFGIVHHRRIGMAFLEGHVFKISREGQRMQVESCRCESV